MKGATPAMRRTKRVISTAFLDILKKKKFEKISIKEILDAAEVNRATFYKYFQDKYDLAKQTLEVILDEYDTTFQEQKSKNPEFAFLQLGSFAENRKSELKALLTIRTSEFNVLAEIASFLCGKYETLRHELKQNSRLYLEPSLFAAICLVPMYKHVTGKFLFHNGYLDSENEQNQTGLEVPLFCESLTNVYAEMMKIDVNALNRFLESQKTSKK